MRRCVAHPLGVARSFFDNKENIIGLSFGMLGGVLLVGVFGSKVRRRLLRKRLTMHAQLFGPWSNPLTADASSPHSNPLRSFRITALYSHLPSRRSTGKRHEEHANTL